MTVMSTRILFNRLADELSAMQVDLERLGMKLCEDAGVVAAHFEQLQALDRIGQQQAAIADILRADDPAAVASTTSLEAMRERLFEH